MSGPLNSPKPTTSVVVGGVYNASTPAPADKQALALQTDNEGNLLVNVAVSGDQHCHYQSRNSRRFSHRE